MLGNTLEVTIAPAGEKDACKERTKGRMLARKGKGAVEAFIDSLFDSF